MKVPRDLSGAYLISHLCRRWQYTKVNQIGSHVMLITETPHHHRLPVPLHSPLGIGLVKRILREVSEAKGVSQSDILSGL